MCLRPGFVPDYTERAYGTPPDHRAGSMEDHAVKSNPLRKSLATLHADCFSGRLVLVHRYAWQRPKLSVSCLAQLHWVVFGHSFCLLSSVPYTVHLFLSE